MDKCSELFDVSTRIWPDTIATDEVLTRGELYRFTLSLNSETKSRDKYGTQFMLVWYERHYQEFHKVYYFVPWAFMKSM